MSASLKYGYTKNHDTVFQFYINDYFNFNDDNTIYWYKNPRPFDSIFKANPNSGNIFIFNNGNLIKYNNGLTTLFS